MSKPHPADDADRAKIAAAASYNVHVRRGPADKINEPAPTLIEAIRIADRVSGEIGKRAMIYAIIEAGETLFVPKAVIDEVRIANADRPLPATSAAAPKAARQPRKATAAAAPETPAEAPEAAAGGDADAKAPKARAAAGKRAGAVLAAERGEMPAVPDFSAETHARFRKKLAAVVALAEAGDIGGLRAVEINPISSSPKAIARYRDLCITALGARSVQAGAEP